MAVVLQQIPVQQSAVCLEVVVKMVSAFQSIQHAIEIKIAKRNNFVMVNNVWINARLLNVQMALFVNMENVFHYAANLYVLLDSNVFKENANQSVVFAEKMKIVKKIRYVTEVFV